MPSIYGRRRRHGKTDNLKLRAQNPDRILKHRPAPLYNLVHRSVLLHLIEKGGQPLISHIVFVQKCPYLLDDTHHTHVRDADHLTLKAYRTALDAGATYSVSSCASEGLFQS